MVPYDSNRLWYRVLLWITLVEGLVWYYFTPFVLDAFTICTVGLVCLTIGVGEVLRLVDERRESLRDRGKRR